MYEGEEIALVTVWTESRQAWSCERATVDADCCAACEVTFRLCGSHVYQLALSALSLVDDE